MTIKHLRLLLAPLLALAVACGPSIEPAEEAVAVFHGLRTAGEYDAIYAATTDGFRERTSAEQFNALMAGLEDKLGPIRTSTRESYTVFRGTQGSSVTLVYSSSFEKAGENEVFVWHLDGDAALLHEYRIDSPAFLTQ
jgi:hypothetical protein